MDEIERQTNNVSRLRKIDETIRPQVESCLSTLEYYGFRPLIDKDVWRDPATQVEMYRRGVSQRKWGFHCAERAGKPASLAADIVDAEYLWDAQRRFWLTLGYAARAQGLNWGGYWGLNPKQKAALGKALNLVRAEQPMPLHLKFGWDVAHVETARVTVAEARRGKR